VVGVVRALKVTQDVNCQDFDGSTPLHLAARNGHTEVAEILLLHGADWTRRDKAGWTPLDDAKKRGRKEVIETIRRFKEAKDGRGYFKKS
jgi:ankyrin repeat protein